MAKRRKPPGAVRTSADLSQPAIGTVAPPANTLTAWSRIAPILLLGTAAVALGCVALQPIASDQTWWQLARGQRAILDRSLRPSAELLVLEDVGEPNAIGAMVVTLVYRWLGASGWMLMRLGVVAAGLWLFLVFWRRSKEPDSRSAALADSAFAVPLALLVVGLSALSPYLDPVPLLFDVIATVALAIWLHAPQSVRSIGRWPAMVGLAGVFVLWANFGNHVAIGLAMLVGAAIDASLLAKTSASTLKAAPFAATAIGVAGVSAMVNPIGWRVWNDSVSLSLAWSVTPAWTIRGTWWAPLTQVDWTWSHWLFFLLTIVTVSSQLIAPQRTRFFAVTMVLQFFTWTCAVILPVAITWMIIHLMVVVVDRAPAGQTLRTILAISAMLVVTAVGIPTVGWGFDSDLDPRFLELALETTDESGTILAVDSRAAGMIAWVIETRRTRTMAVDRPARLQDEWRRALVGRRLVEHQRLVADLRLGQQMSYWRDDESQGGWWLPVTERDTSLVVCSRRDLLLVRRLEPTIWKPLTLDSPVLIYARAGDPTYASLLVERLGQREFINSGMWQYRPPTSTGSVYDRDRFGLVPYPESLRQALEQADVFAAMELHTATLSVLNDVRQQSPRNPRYLAAWRSCQVALADRERVNVGMASWLRTLASQPAAFARSGNTAGQASREVLAEIPPSEIGQWERLIAVYRDQGAAAALAKIEPVVRGQSPDDWPTLTPASHEQLRYAAIEWARESGRRDDAVRWAFELKNAPDASMVVRLLAEHQWVDANFYEAS